MPTGLLKHKCNDIDLFYTQEVKEERGLIKKIDLDVEACNNVRKYLEVNKGHNGLVEAYAKKNNLENIALFIVNGQDINGKWGYYNEDKPCYVQNFINSKDGKYKVIIIDSPNPGRSEIHSKKTPVLTIEGLTIVDFYLPGKKDSIEPYMIDEELENLRE